MDFFVTMSKIKSMKRFYLLGLALYANAFVFASGIDFLNVSNNAQWEEVLKRAKKENKLLFVDFYTDWCGWCKKMDKEVFSIQEVGNYYNQEFINLKIDAENDQLGAGLAAKFKVEGFPTYLFIDSEQMVVSTLVGYQQKSQLIESGLSAISIWRLLPELKAKAQKGKLSPSETRDLAVLMAKQDGTDAAMVYANQYAKDFKNEYLSKPEDFEFAMFFLKAIDSPTFEYFSKNYRIIAQSVGVEKVDEYKYIIFEDNFMKAVAKNDEAALNRLIDKLSPIYLDGATQSENDMLRFTMQSGFYERTENWEKFIELIENFRDTKAEDKAAFIFGQSEKIALQLPDSRLIKKAIDWMQVATSQSKTFDNHFLLSILYLRNENTQEAKNQLSKAQVLAKSDEEKEKVNELQKYIKP